MTSHVIFFLLQLNLPSWVDWAHIWGSSKSTTFWSAKYPYYYLVTPHVTFFVHAEYSPPINQELLALGWPFTILKASNWTGQPARSEKDLATFKSAQPASLMAWSFACHSLYQKPLFDGKNKLAGKTPIKGNNCCTPVPATTFAYVPAIALVIAPLAASGSANSSLVRYSEDVFLRILRTVLDFRPSVSIPAPIIASAPHYEGSRELPLGAWFLDIYWSKTHLECYNFF